jgi:trehalose 6-phosphate synthase
MSGPIFALLGRSHCREAPSTAVGGRTTTRAKIATRAVVHGDVSHITLDLPKEDHREYCNGFAESRVVPALYYRVGLAEFSRRDLGGYLRVNDHFAPELHHVLGTDDIV